MINTFCDFLSQSLLAIASIIGLISLWVCFPNFEESLNNDRWWISKNKKNDKLIY